MRNAWIGVIEGFGRLGASYNRIDVDLALRRRYTQKSVIYHTTAYNIRNIFLATCFRIELEVSGKGAWLSTCTVGTQHAKPSSPSARPSDAG